VKILHYISWWIKSFVARYANSWKMIIWIIVPELAASKVNAGGRLSDVVQTLRLQRLTEGVASQEGRRLSWPVGIFALRANSVNGMDIVATLRLQKPMKVAVANTDVEPPGAFRALVFCLCIISFCLCFLNCCLMEYSAPFWLAPAIHRRSVRQSTAAAPPCHRVIDGDGEHMHTSLCRDRSRLEVLRWSCLFTVAVFFAGRHDLALT